MTKFNKFLDLIEGLDYYPKKSDLLYKFKFTRSELEKILSEKRNCDRFLKLPLCSEEGNNLIYLLSDFITSKFSDSDELLLNADIEELSDIKNLDLVDGFLFSEIESTLSIEGIRSSRAKIKKINSMDYSELVTNDIVVKNMLNAYNYVQNNDINENTIYELYQILSMNCLSKNELLLDSNRYRHDAVNIIGSNEEVIDKGVNHNKLDNLMSSLVDFISEEKSREQHLLMPHIIHYYMVYLHPYFDYNGRMARVMSYWYSIRHIPSFTLMFMSEAINSKKNKRLYYQAISNSRRTDNDITYFLEYMANVTLQFTKTYINYYSIIRNLKGNGITINGSTSVALKYVLALPKIGEGYFDWKDYKNFSHDDFSKVQYLKLLNTLVEMGVLTTKEHKKTKLFKLNDDKLEYILD